MGRRKEKLKNIHDRGENKYSGIQNEAGKIKTTTQGERGKRGKKEIREWRREGRRRELNRKEEEEGSREEWGDENGRRDGEEGHWKRSEVDKE